MACVLLKAIQEAQRLSRDFSLVSIGHTNYRRTENTLRWPSKITGDPLCTLPRLVLFSKYRLPTFVNLISVPSNLGRHLPLLQSSQVFSGHIGFRSWPFSDRIWPKVEQFRGQSESAIVWLNLLYKRSILVNPVGKSPSLHSHCLSHRMMWSHGHPGSVHALLQRPLFFQKHTQLSWAYRIRSPVRWRCIIRRSLLELLSRALLCYLDGKRTTIFPGKNSEEIFLTTNAGTNSIYMDSFCDTRVSESLIFGCPSLVCHITILIPFQEDCTFELWPTRYRRHKSLSKRSFRTALSCALMCQLTSIMSESFMDGQAMSRRSPRLLVLALFNLPF